MSIELRRQSFSQVLWELTESKSHASSPVLENAQGLQAYLQCLLSFLLPPAVHVDFLSTRMLKKPLARGIQHKTFMSFLFSGPA